MWIWVVPWSRHSIAPVIGIRIRISHRQGARAEAPTVQPGQVVVSVAGPLAQVEHRRLELCFRTGGHDSDVGQLPFRLPLEMRPWSFWIHARQGVGRASQEGRDQQGRRAPQPAPVLDDEAAKTGSSQLVLSLHVDAQRPDLERHGVAIVEQYGTRLRGFSIGVAESRSTGIAAPHHDRPRRSRKVNLGRSPPTPNDSQVLGAKHFPGDCEVARPLTQGEGRPAAEIADAQDVIPPPDLDLHPHAGTTPAAGQGSALPRVQPR